MSRNRSSDKARTAAVNRLKRDYKKKMRRNRSPLFYVGLPISLVLIVACLFSIVSDKVELSSKQEELELLKAQAAELEAENASYQSILSEEDERTYMERIATEKLGYAYPDERRFYDTTQN